LILPPRSIRIQDFENLPDFPILSCLSHIAPFQNHHFCRNINVLTPSTITALPPVERQGEKMTEFRALPPRNDKNAWRSGLGFVLDKVNVSPRHADRYRAAAGYGLNCTRPINYNPHAAPRIKNPPTPLKERDLYV
jgi:hypothetical protein